MYHQQLDVVAPDEADLFETQFQDQKFVTGHGDDDGKDSQLLTAVCRVV